MLTKDDLLKTIQDLPMEFSLDEIIDKLILLDKIEIGLTQSDNGETVSTDEARKQLSKWFR